MSLVEKAAAARFVADASGDRGDIAAADALEAALAAEARQLIGQLREEPDTAGIPTPTVSRIVIPLPCDGTGLR